MSELLKIPLTKEYKYTLEIVFEIADTSMLCFVIDETLGDYISNLNKNLDNDDINIEYTLLIKRNSLSSSYLITLKSNKFSKLELSKYSSEIVDKILKLDEFKDIIVLTKDEGKNIICETLYPKILCIETILRAIVNTIHMQSCGNGWKKEISIKTKLANNKRDKEFDLNEIFLDTLVEIIFKINFNGQITIPENLDELNKKELIHIINKVRFKSFWDTFFPTIKLHYEDMEKLIHIRNKVMHFKPIHFKEFHQHIKNCEKVLQLIEKAEKQINGKKFKFTKQMIESINKLSEVMHSFTEKIIDNAKKLSEGLNPIMSQICNITTKMKTK